MKKIVLLILFSFFSIGVIVSQTDSQLSQYMFNPSIYNPAAAGENEMMEISWQHRIQWVGIPNAGQSSFYNVNSPVNLFSNQHGIGLQIVNENIGLFSNLDFHFQYAFKKALSGGILSIGASLGFLDIGFKGDSVHFPTIGEYYESNDPLIPTTSVSGISFDVGLGVWYSNTKGYAGFSYAHLNQPVINWGENLAYKQVGTLYLTGGYNWILNDPKYIIKPSLLFKSDLNSYQVDISAFLEYNSKYWGGLSYRFQDAVVLFGGINAIAGLIIGYSYDLPVSQIIRGSSGSHEFLIAYNFDIKLNKAKHKHKSIRIL